MRLRMLFLVPLAAASLAIGAQVHEHAPPATPAAPATAVEKLSPELRELFRQEMLGLQNAMVELVPAIVSGDWESTARLADRMQAGFVLDRRLTAAQREELHRTLPEGFLERDIEFHELARGLATAAHARRPELVTFHLYKLADSCVSCHSRYATHRFPALAPTQAPPAHRH